MPCQIERPPAGRPREVKGPAPNAHLRYQVQPLKWCFELGIETYWSILYGFPGETREAYDEMASLIPRLGHLPPPMQVLPFQMHRFSPYFLDAASHGLHEVRPYWSYAFAHPGLGAERLHDIAYSFEFRYSDRERPEAFAVALLAGVKEWDRAYLEGAVLRFEEDASILDTATGRAKAPASRRWSTTCYSDRAKSSRRPQGSWLSVA